MKHFTRNTVSASSWCGKCGKRTQHRVDGVKLGPCLECIAKLEKRHEDAAGKEPVPKQQGLFQ